MLQEIIVTLIVVVALAYMAWRYLPAAWRQRLGRLHPSLAQGPGGCGSGGGCSSCGGCSAAQGAAAQPPVPERAGRHFHASK
ncbi:MAG: hypothetical protein JSR16_02660 [Proteobacteria bacterium]|nr:hypothetical protein [Pseudomonadota bacterium]MBS0301059.1 hypothetical protein [Pseudomonadota bacterium]